MPVFIVATNAVDIGSGKIVYGSHGDDLYGISQKDE